MAPMKLQARSNSVAQIAAAKAPVKAAPAPKAAGDIVGVDPLLLGAAWRIFLGGRTLLNPSKAVSGQFADAKTENAKANNALALRTGLLNLQVAALQIAACNAGMKTVTKRNLHAAMAINNFSSAGLAAYNHQVNGLGGAEANMRMAVTVGLGVLAAAQAVQENSSL